MIKVNKLQFEKSSNEFNAPIYKLCNYDSNGEWEYLGWLEYDCNQQAWVFWTKDENGDEGITYYDGLEESEQQVIEEYEDMN